ncbi:unnamed protein product [Sphenostylis stenocarpa]|uniref:Uncharacterized protein n=1 Tax=Sphenostylis stenocarpa TaxID=92480 RepID=A0AA86RYH6_9FABA|nr:unnamed protein product [Sphenostylis stenocarpa]
MLSRAFLFLGMLISKEFGDMLMLQEMHDAPQTVSNYRQLSLANIWNETLTKCPER